LIDNMTNRFEPAQFYRKLKDQEIRKLLDSLKDQIVEEEPLVGFHGFYFEGDRIVHDKSMNIWKVKKRMLKSPFLAEYISGFWTRLTPRIELVKKGTKDFQKNKRRIEEKVALLVFSIANAIANLNKSHIDYSIARETVLMLDSVILNSIKKLV